mmetsp:Transcript_26342/g.45010  ORF Transcript_26342/g.45010 Transcript_26342/m.45010 type:complete len:161 (+) Transcript_26342:11-493(+)
MAEPQLSDNRAGDYAPADEADRASTASALACAAMRMRAARDGDEGSPPYLPAPRSPLAVPRIAAPASCGRLRRTFSVAAAARARRSAFPRLSRRASLRLGAGDDDDSLPLASLVGVDVSSSAHDESDRRARSDASTVVSTRRNRGTLAWAPAATALVSGS